MNLEEHSAEPESRDLSMNGQCAYQPAQAAHPPQAQHPGSYYKRHPDTFAFNIEWLWDQKEMSGHILLFEINALLSLPHMSQAGPTKTGLSFVCWESGSLAFGENME